MANWGIDTFGSLVQWIKSVNKENTSVVNIYIYINIFYTYIIVFYVDDRLYII